MWIVSTASYLKNGSLNRAEFNAYSTTIFVARPEPREQTAQGIDLEGDASGGRCEKWPRGVNEHGATASSSPAAGCCDRAR